MTRAHLRRFDHGAGAQTAPLACPDHPAGEVYPDACILCTMNPEPRTHLRRFAWVQALEQHHAPAPIAGGEVLACLIELHCRDDVSRGQGRDTVVEIVSWGIAWEAPWLWMQGGADPPALLDTREVRRNTRAASEVISHKTEMVVLTKQNGAGHLGQERSLTILHLLARRALPKHLAEVPIQLTQRLGRRALAAGYYPSRHLHPTLIYHLFRTLVSAPCDELAKLASPRNLFAALAPVKPPQRVADPDPVSRAAPLKGGRA